MSASLSAPPAPAMRPAPQARSTRSADKAARLTAGAQQPRPAESAWWEGLFQAELPLVHRSSDEGDPESKLSEGLQQDRSPEQADTLAADASEIHWDVTASATGVGERIEYAQAQTGQSDDASRVSVSKMPPWTLALGGLLAGAAVVALGSDSDEFRQLTRSWTQGDLSVTAEANSRTVIDAAGLRAGPPVPKLTLTGPGAVEVLNLKVSSEIIASNLLTGTLRVTTANDSEADTITIATGSGDTRLELADGFDIVEVDASKLTGLGKLTVSGQVGTLVVSNLTAILDTSALVGTVVEVHTGVDESPIPKALASGPVVQVVAGDSSLSVDSDRANETVKIDAGRMGEGNQLQTSGDGAFQVSQFAANLVNTAAGGIEVTLGNTGEDLIAAVTIASSTAAVVYNGLLGDDDEIDLIELASAVDFTVRGLKARELDARLTTGLIKVETADVNDNVVIVRTGEGDMMIEGRSAGDRIDVIASEQAVLAELTLGGQSAVVVTDFSAVLDAAGHSAGVLSGSLSVATPSGGANATINVATGSGNTRVTVSNLIDTAVVDAGAMATGSVLTTDGLGSVNIRDLASPLVNSAGQQVIATLARRDGAAPFTFQVTSSSAITVLNGTAQSDDVIRLLGQGAMTVLGLVADVDADGASGAVNVTTAQGAVLDVAVGTGEFGANSITSDGGAIAVDATALLASVLPAGDVAGVARGALRLDGTSAFVVRGLKGWLDGASLPGSADVDVYLFDGAPQVDPNAVADTFSGQIMTGRGDDSVHFHHSTGGGDRPITPDGAVIDLGAGQNEVHVGRGVPVEGVFDLRGASFQSSDGGDLSLVISNSRSVMLRSAQLQAAAGEAEAAFNDIQQAHDVLASELFELPSGSATVMVDTMAGALEGGFQLDPSIRYWQIGVEGNGNNDVRLGNNAQSIIFGEGVDTVRLNGRVAGDLVGVEFLDVSRGGSIAAAMIVPELGSSAQLDDVFVDFDLSDAELRLTTVQHAAMEPGGQALLVNAGFGEQTMIFANRIADRGLVAGFVPQVRGLDDIERYELSSEALTDVQPGHVRSRLGGLAAATDSDGNMLTVVNDFVQRTATEILGSTGNDAIRTSGSDAVRGGLTLELGAGGQDLVFVNNTDWGNFSGGLGGGLGGAVLLDLGTGEFTNAGSLAATTALWPGVGSGTQAVRIEGFAASGSAPDRIAFVNDFGDALGQPGFTGNIAGALADPVGDNRVLEFSAAFTDQATNPWGDINSATALNQVAQLLASNVAGSQVENGLYYVMLYSDTSPTADAWLYAAVATESDGFDFAQTGSDFADRDTVELIAVFEDVGANSFTGENLAYFPSQLPPLPFADLALPIILQPPAPN